MAAGPQTQPVLVPVDFSPDSEAALGCAAELATLFKAPLLIVHVVHDPGEAPGYYAVKGRNKHLQKLEDVAAGMLAEFVQAFTAAHPGLAVLKTAETRLVTGLPVNRILETADKSAARMIVMGSQGRTGLRRALLGSKAEQVVRLARVPVTIVKSDRETDRADPKEEKRAASE